MASTSAGRVRLTAKTTRNDPTPAENRFTMYQNLLFGGASSDSSKIWRLQEGGISRARAAAVVPRVKNTYPLMKSALLNVIFCNTFVMPKQTEAAAIPGSI